jgi:hypothetical protein
MNNLDISKKKHIGYDSTIYFSINDWLVVHGAHQALAASFASTRGEEQQFYWSMPAERNRPCKYQTERVGSLIVHSGALQTSPLPLVAVWFDSQIKAYMDRDALGALVKRGINRGAQLSSEAREVEIGRRTGGSSFRAETMLIAVTYGGYVLGGMMVNPGTLDMTVAEVMRSRSHRPRSIAALQAKFSLGPDDPFLLLKENEIVDLIKYFRVPDAVLREIIAADLIQGESYRRIVHLIRALTISEAFATTERWAREADRRITTGVCETPNDDVKLLFRGRKGRDARGAETTVGGIPHRVLTDATGAELYPEPYKNRPEGKTKFYTLYAFDFERIAAESRLYRAGAISWLKTSVRRS